MISELTSLGNAWSGFLVALVTGFFGWLIARERRLAGDRTPAPAQLRDGEKKDISIVGPMVLLIIGAAFGLFSIARPLLLAKMAPPVPAPESTDAGLLDADAIDLEAVCDAATCQKKTGCRCVGGANGNCNCNTAEKKPDVLPNLVTPPQTSPAKKKDKLKPTSSLAQVLPKMAGELQPPWFANLPPSSGPISPL